MHPEILRIGQLQIPSYGVLVGLGAVVGLWVTVENCQRLGFDGKKIWHLGILALFAGIIGSKILFILNYWSYYVQNPAEILTRRTLQTGGVFSGGLVCGLVAFVWLVHLFHFPALATMDCFAPGLALGHAIGRVGCFLAGCCFGTQTNATWAVVFTDPKAHQLSGTPLGIPLHPTQLIECGLEIFNFFLLSWMVRCNLKDGKVSAAYLILYCSARYFIEFLRGDPGRGNMLDGLITSTQLISVLLATVGFILWFSRPAQAVSETR